MERLGDVIEKVSAYNPEADTALLERAYVYSAKVHQGQLRKSGEPYLSHPLAVASTLADFKMDTTTIAAGLLHDTLEDTATTEEELKSFFGEEIATLVGGVTKIGKMAFSTALEKEAANYRKMILAMASDVRIIIIKLADRLHNMRTLEYLSPAKRKRVAQETLEVYAPLAHRLGMGGLKVEMEELAFRNLEPEVYADISARVAKKRREREKYVKELKASVVDRLKEMGIESEVYGRAKHFYSIHKKMQKQRISFDEVYDLIALRVITDSLKDCYGALGIIHSLWKPIPGKFKDYIAMPKENMYQSLHTTVVGPEGERVEFQIRTREMNSIAEEGIAAHWKYKEGDKGVGLEERVTWLRRTLELMQDVKDPREFLETFKMDLFPDEVYVFTPKGDVRSFPRGASPVDFAYAIHTEIGQQCVGARVNGRLVPLRYQLKNGDRLEILTSPTHRPSKDWLTFAITSRARTKIKAYLKQEQRERSITLGKSILEKELRRYGVGLAKVLKSAEMEALLAAMGFKNSDELMANIGYGKISAVMLVKKLVPPDLLAKETPKEGPFDLIAKKIGLSRKEGGIKVDGLDDVLIKFSKCCHPVPGDKIIGFITRGRGISVHMADCQAAAASLLDPARRVEVEWSTAKGAVFPVHILVEARDRPGLLAKMSECISEAGANIISGKMHTADGKAFNDFEVTIGDTEQLSKIINAIRKVKGVESVTRQRARPTAKTAGRAEKGA